MAHHILLLPGDGIGPEITAQAVKVLNAIAERFKLTFTYDEAPIGGAGIAASGVPLPDDTRDKALKADAVFLGAVGDYKYDDIDPKLRPEQGLLQVRQALGVYANLRPVSGYKALTHTSTLKPEVIDGIDLLVVRELTGGLYFGQPRGIELNAQGVERGFDTMEYTRPEIERIAHVAFKAAQGRKKQLCSVDKANVLKTSQLWRQVVTEIGEQHYPDVSLSHMYVDNAAMQLIRSPKQFDVMLTENTFGDILSDEASMLTGSLGMLASASLGDGSKPFLYEPSHGSAPKYAGLNKVNPIATIVSAALMLRHSFNLPEAANAIEQAIAQVLADGLRTYDIMNDGEPGLKLVGTAEMGYAIAQAVLSPVATR
ncbi:MAG: 3-isopropylmalate dehydrogenase [Vampirovibrionales bacterium]|nr:3-isopropylmalate dehydrogenase [Vampirovibrionales bacterium]